MHDTQVSHPRTEVLLCGTEDASLHVWQVGVCTAVCIAAGFDWYWEWLAVPWHHSGVLSIQQLGWHRNYGVWRWERCSKGQGACMGAQSAKHLQ